MLDKKMKPPTKTLICHSRLDALHGSWALPPAAGADRKPHSDSIFGQKPKHKVHSESYSLMSLHCCIVILHFGDRRCTVVADPNIINLSSFWWSTEPDLCGGVCFYELVLTKIACWHLQCGPMGHFRGLGFRDLSWCGQFRFQMFHMIKDSKSGLPLKKRTMSRMSIHQNLCLNRRLHLLESLAGWWVNQKFPKIIKSSSRKYMKVFSSGLLDSVLGTLAIHRPQGTPVVLGVLMVNIQKTAGAKRQHSWEPQRSTVFGAWDKVHTGSSGVHESISTDFQQWYQSFIQDIDDLRNGYLSNSLWFSHILALEFTRMSTPSCPKNLEHVCHPLTFIVTWSLNLQGRQRKPSLAGNDTSICHI